jgi:predicted DNA-binding protein YlxM (UPF0122 family)
MRKDIDELVALYDKGYSVQQIAESIGISKQSLWKSFKLRGIVMRKDRLPKLEKRDAVS